MMDLHCSDIPLSMQTAHDKGAEFWVREFPNGAIAFESIAFPGEFVHFRKGKKKNKVLVRELYVYYLVNSRRVKG